MYKVNGSTNVQLVGLAAALATILIWILSHYAPALMADAPAGLEAAMTGIFTVIVGTLAKPNAGIKQLPGTGEHK